MPCANKIFIKTNECAQSACAYYYNHLMYVHRKIHLKNINLHTSYYDLSTDYTRFIYYILFSYGFNYNSVFQDIITLLKT